MIDLFGMGKAPQETPELPEPGKPRAGSHGLWLSLLVLDSICVIVFGGMVAAKVYQCWKTPSLAAVPIVRRRPVPKAPVPKAAEPPPAPKPPAPAPEAPKPAAKPEPRVARGADAPRPPKPSLLNEPPKPRSTPGLATSVAAAVPSASAAKKAQPVVFKIRSSNADAVQLVGAFIVHGGRKEMTQASDGTWSVKLYLNPGQYRYFFSVDNKKTLDPENPNSDRGASLLTIP